MARANLPGKLDNSFFYEQNNDLIFATTLNTENIETLALVDSYLTLGRHLGITEYMLTSLESLKNVTPIEAAPSLDYAEDQQVYQMVDNSRQCD